MSSADVRWGLMWLGIIAAAVFLAWALWKIATK